MQFDVPVDWIKAQIALTQSDDESVQRKAWDELAAFLWPRIRFIAIMEVRRSWNTSGSWQMAEDLAVTTFIVAFRNIKKLREPAGIMGWLRIVLRRQLMKHYNKFKPEHLTDALPDGSHFGTNSGDSIVAQLRFEIARLPLAQRRALHVRYWEDLEAKECAVVLDISLRSFWLHLGKAHTNLRKALLAPGFTLNHVGGTLLGPATGVASCL
jgi:DNA-directed RNA polymerase specialized sigma24 family protein